MKKFIAFVLAAVAVSAQATTLDWGLGGEIYLMEKGKTYADAIIATDAAAPAVPGGAYLALVYVGQNADSFDIGDITASSIKDTMPYAVDTTYGGADYDPYQQTYTISPNDYVNGASFGVVWFNGESFDYVYSIDDGSALNWTVTVDDVERSTPDGMLAASYTNGYGGVLTVSVPEPGIACMALLGIGMLIKRRRA